MITMMGTWQAMLKFECHPKPKDEPNRKRTRCEMREKCLAMEYSHAVGGRVGKTDEGLAVGAWPRN